LQCFKILHVFLDLEQALVLFDIEHDTEDVPLKFCK
jgi:hypothetical protein